MDLTGIGYFSKTHGIKGHLILKSEIDFYFEDLTAIFIDEAGSKAPYFISEISESNNGIIVLLEEVSSVEKAKTLIGKKALIDSQFIAEKQEQTDWTGYTLIDGVCGDLGKIIAVSDNGQQVIVTLQYKNKEIILPLVDDFIDRIDEEKKTVFYKAPEGLIDVYLNE